MDEEQRKAAEHLGRQRASEYLAEGFTASSPARVGIVEHYMSTGKWPSSNEEVGLPPPERYKGVSLRRMEVSGLGVITLTYDSNSGVEGGTIRLIPEAGELTMGVKWKCETASYPAIAITFPDCEYLEKAS